MNGTNIGIPFLNQIYAARGGVPNSRDLQSIIRAGIDASAGLAERQKQLTQQKMSDFREMQLANEQREAQQTDKTMQGIGKVGGLAWEMGGKDLAKKGFNTAVGKVSSALGLGQNAALDPALAMSGVDIMNPELIGEGAGTIAQQSPSIVSSVGQSLSDLVPAGIKDVASAVPSAINGLTTTVGGVAQNIGTQVMNALPSAVGSVASALPSTISSIASYATPAGYAMAGKDLFGALMSLPDTPATNVQADLIQNSETLEGLMGDGINKLFGLDGQHNAETARDLADPVGWLIKQGKGLLGSVLDSLFDW